MNAKHTPGPWRVNRNIGRKSELGITADAAPCIIAIMGNADAWPTEAEANAQLIAAAPALLEALEDCLTFDGATAERSHEMALKRLRAINDIALAAIAQAKGEQP